MRRLNKTKSSNWRLTTKRLYPNSHLTKEMINIGFLASSQKKVAELSDSQMNCSQKPSYTSLEPYPTAASTQHTRRSASTRSLDRPDIRHITLRLALTARRLKRASDGVWVFFTEIPTDTRLQIHQQIGDTD